MRTRGGEAAHFRGGVFRPWSAVFSRIRPHSAAFAVFVSLVSLGSRDSAPYPPAPMPVHSTCNPNPNPDPTLTLTLPLTLTLTLPYP